jgi:signal transduction histidine kinase
MDDATIKRISTSENFYSAKGTDKETGVGLGLKIVKDFIRAHNGEMLIKSNPGKGSCFIVRLNKH